MDLNRLYNRHQASLLTAAKAACDGARRSHGELANGYASLSRGEAADQLREQAASCRRLAQRARTDGGSTALTTVADHFDDDARRIDPSSLKR
jgi:hypothetical protein